MKKFKKIIFVIIIVFVAITMVIPFFNLNAQETLKSPLKDVISSIDDLANLKDNNDLSDEEKTVKEIEIRGQALLKIAGLSLLEVENLKNKLESLVLDSDEEVAIKDKFLLILDSNKEYSEELQKKIEETENLTLKEIKVLAQDFKEWRGVNYTETVKDILSFILVFQQKNAVRTADTRLEKINTDIRKLEIAKMIKKEDTWNLLNNAMKNLTSAHLYIDKAEDMLIPVLREELLDSATTSPEEIASEEENNSTTTVKDINTEIKVLVGKSLNEVRSAYKNFLSISNKIRKKIGY
ncbi:MAG: hypothetical protein PHP03_02600 [Candidatus Pacebacteria bacterium]|nr:hypothetical protein [Candidatus Paceibacterota bacterium]